MLFADGGAMRTYQASITSQGQVTIPSEIRKEFGLTKKGKVEFIVEDGKVHLAAPMYMLEEVFGSIPAIPSTSENWDEETELGQRESMMRLFEPDRK